LIDAAIGRLGDLPFQKAFGHRPEALALVAWQINKAAKGSRTGKRLAAARFVADGPADEVISTGGEG
jgi:hypothetical protein